MRVGDRSTEICVFTPEQVDAVVRLGASIPAPGLTPRTLIDAVFSRALGTALPGPGSNYLKQSTRYLSEAEVGEALRFEVVVTRMRPDKSLVDLSTTCASIDGRPVAEGRALIFIGDRFEPLAPELALHEDSRP